MTTYKSYGRANVRSQSASGPATTQMVDVAVLPPRLPPGMAPPTGVGAADVFDWDESLNWQHNQPIQEGERKKSFLQKAGLTTQRTRRNPDLPNFVMRSVPYDVWRKHYAKDKDGNYRGTHAPAEDCLLKPEDVAKWSTGEATTNADRWTRGKHALPVYGEEPDSGVLPQYVESAPVADEKNDVVQTLAPSERTASGHTIEGKTTEEIIAEAKAKAVTNKQGWRTTFKKGAERAAMGAW